MNLMYRSNISRKKKLDLLTKVVIFSFSILAFIALALMFVFLIKAAYPAYQKYGFFQMYFSADFSEKGNWGIWSPLLITLITSFLAILIATPIALRAAFFIRFRLRNGQKTIRTIINILAGVPSVIFGIFAIKSLKIITNLLIGSNSGNTILNATFTLVVIIMPILISLILNQLTLLPQDLINSSIALGNTRTYVMYTTVKKSIKSNIYVAIIVALGRAIGETMALSIILISNSPNPFVGGISAFFGGDFGTLGVLIAKNIFTDHGRDPSPLFAAGLALLFIVMILVIVITKISKQRKLANTSPFANKPWNQVDKSVDGLIKWIMITWFYLLLPFRILRFIFIWLFLKLTEFWHFVLYYLSYPLTHLFLPRKLKEESYSDYYVKFVQDKRSSLSSYIRIFLEWVCIGFVLSVIFWIIVDLCAVGMSQYNLSDWAFSNEIVVIGGLTKQVPSLILNPLVWTLVLIGLSIVIAIPFALCAALYLSEYANQKRNGKILRFFLDSLGGTPSIIFGIFGLIFFIQTLNFHGKAPFSLIAGALTVVLVILPTFTRAIEQVLIKVPDSYRSASYALGSSKTKTIFKVVFPQSISGIITGIILSMGRIMGETAPVFLTLGLTTVIVEIGFLLPGHTLTTNILDIFINNREALSFEDQINLSYKIGSVALIATSFLILVAQSIPWWGSIFRHLLTKMKKRHLLKHESKLIESQNLELSSKKQNVKLLNNQTNHSNLDNVVKLSLLRSYKT